MNEKDNQTTQEDGVRKELMLWVDYEALLREGGASHRQKLKSLLDTAVRLNLAREGEFADRVAELVVEGRMKAFFEAELARNFPIDPTAQEQTFWRDMQAF